MKRLLIAALATLALTASFTLLGQTPVDASIDGTSTVAHPVVVDHNVPANESYNICLFLKPGTPDWGIHHWRSLHYGTADVVQCEFYSWLLDEFACGMYVWNVPTPWFSFYPPEGIHPFCW